MRRPYYEDCEPIARRLRLSPEELARTFPMFETMRLRWIQRDGQPVLQQYFQRPVVPLDLMPLDGYVACEWRDVPLLEAI